MFVRYYTLVDHPYEQVSRALLDAREAWLPAVAQTMSTSHPMVAELGVGFRGARFHKAVDMTFGEPSHLDETRTCLPFRWKATGIPALFPSFDGDIQVCTWHKNTTQLALSANYQPPLGPIGLMLDKAALHLVAEALVKDFVDRVAAALDQAVANVA